MLKNILSVLIGCVIGWGIFSLSGRLFYGGMIILFVITFVFQPYTNHSADQQTVKKDALILKYFTLIAVGYVIGGIITTLIY